MKKSSKLFYLLSIILVIIFLVILLIDYINYDTSTSFPFYATIIFRSIQLLIPSLISFIIGLILNKKKNR